jgi:LPXTG-site transpeptidase (sortase) family protein
MNSAIKILLKSAVLIIPGLALFIYLAGNYSIDKGLSGISDLKSNEKQLVFKAPPESVKQSTLPSPFLEYLEPVEAMPVRLLVPSQNINVEIVEVGVTADGALEAPTDWTKAGWYKKSAFPGRKGNVIIDGHYDTNTGSAAAFWNLKNLKVGDKVVVADEYGVEHTYVVNELIHVSITDTNRLEKLNKHSGRTLTLITCGGFWNPVIGTYDERLIVKALADENRLAKETLN